MTPPAWLPPLPVALPLAGAALLGAGGKHTPRRLADAAAIVIAAAVTAACVALAFAAHATPSVYWLGGWQLRGGVPLGIALVVDVGGAAFAGVGALLTTLALVFATRSFDTVGAMFHALMLVFLAGVCGFALTGDLFNLFVWFEVMSTAAYALCAYKSEEPAPLQGGINFAVCNTVGAFFLVVGLGLIYGRTGALNLAEIGHRLAGHPDALVTTAFAFIAVAFLVKAAIVPFHFWLADAHAVAPAPVCVLFSGIMVEVGLFGVMRVHAAAFADVLPLSSGLRTVLLAAGALTAIVGALMSFAQRHLKRLLAFSTVSHMGSALAGWALATPKATAGALMYLVGHSVAKGALFFVAGLVLHCLRDVDEIALRGRGRDHRFVGLLLALGGLGLAGAPWDTIVGDLTAAEVAEAQHRVWFSPVAQLCALVTGGAVLRAAARIFLGIGSAEPEAPDVGGQTGEPPETKGPRRAPLTMLVPPIVLIVAGALLNLLPLARGVAARAAGQLGDHGGYLLLVLGGAGADPASPLPSPPSLAHALWTPLAAVALAALTLARHKLSAALRRRGRAIARALWTPLRLVHTGHIGDQVAFLTVGATALAAALLLLYR